jgi:hypothetical protein
MNLSQAKDYLPFIQAAAEGKTIQRWDGSTWADWLPDENIEFSDPPEKYRIKPSPKLRPWKPEEVPVGCLLKDKSLDFSLESISVLLCRRGAWCHYMDHMSAKMTADTTEALLKKFTHSIDGGKTWKPCGVE